MCNLLKDRDLQTLVGRTEFDVSHTNRDFAPISRSLAYCVGSRYRRSVPSAKMMPVSGQVSDSHNVPGAVSRPVSFF